MIFKYFVEFDNNGEIKALHRNERKGCKEYIVKLIPIEREKDLTDKAKEAADEILRGSKKFRSEIEKISRDLRRIRL